MAWIPNSFAGQQYKGLKNQGTTCYLNSVLQCLYMTEVFRREVENFTRDSKNSEEESTDLIEELQKLFNILKEHHGTTEGITRCLRISNVNEQQDVVEYYQKILYMITPQMSTIFKGELKTCIKCWLNHKHEQKCPNFCIPLPIDSEDSEVFSVDRGIEIFSKKATLSEDNMAYCDLCDEKAEAETWTEIETFPTILTLNLQRFFFNYYVMKLVKNHCPVRISLQLEFKNHTKYELYAVINHMGEENGGHYYAVIKSFEDNEWYCFDDSIVTKEHGFEESLQRSKLAYLLMYKKMDDPHPDMSTNFSTNSAEQVGQATVPVDYHTPDLNRELGQNGHCVQLFSKSFTCVMKDDAQESARPAAFQGNDISNTSGLNVPVPDFPSHWMEDLERDKRLPIEFLNLEQYLHDKGDKMSSLKNITEMLTVLSSRVEEVSNRDSSMISALQKRVESLEKENSVLHDKCEKLDADKRRWNLQVTGIQERQGEDIRKILIDLFSKVSPDIADQLSYTLDVAYRVGSGSEGAHSSHRIIVHFLSRNVRDQIWRDAKTAAVLKERKVGIFEDFTRSTKDARKTLWPLVEQARKEGKKASLRGHYAYIDGKRIYAKDLLA